MIDRYSREKMSRIWSQKNRFQKMLEVEIEVAQVQAQLRIIPQKAALQIKKKAKFQESEISKIEEKVKHDVIAFVTNVASKVGEEGRFVHYGLTSSDVLDTAMSLVVREANEEMQKSCKGFEIHLSKLIKKHAKTLCVGRTHGMHAEPTTFGYKLLGFYFEFQRAKKRYDLSIQEMMITKLSGAVGTYSTQPEEVERRLAKRLGLKAENVATQVIPRDRHAAMLSSMALMARFLERFATEVRHLQRSEVSEVEEGFVKGQKGSSAMPHKRNPIASENICGISRMIASYAQVAQENMVLWHERDISHSSAERVILPDAFILLDYAINRMTNVLTNLMVYPDKMKKNLILSSGNVYSSQVLLALVDKGISREVAYQLVQSTSHGLKAGQTLMTGVLKNPEITKILNKKEIHAIFNSQEMIKRLSLRIQDSLKIK